MIKKFVFLLAFVFGAAFFSVTAIAAPVSSNAVYSFSCPNYSDVKVTYHLNRFTATAKPTKGTPSDLYQWVIANPVLLLKTEIAQPNTFMSAKLGPKSVTVECWYDFEIIRPGESGVKYARIPLTLAGKISNYTFSVSDSNIITATPKSSPVQ